MPTEGKRKISPKVKCPSQAFDSATDSVREEQEKRHPIYQHATGSDLAIQLHS